MMRLDRSLTLYFFGPLVKVLQRRRGLCIPILMYHSISNDSEDGTHPYYKISTSPKRFAEHMQFLHDYNYKVIDLSEAVKIISEASVSPNTPTFHHSNIPQGEVVLTFDDGYKDFYTHAFPILKQYGFSATVFLPISFINSGRKPGLKGKEHLNWEEVRELQNMGVTFGSHTVNHLQLRFLNRAEIEREVEQSKRIVEEKIGKFIQSFSYPFAFPDEDKEFKRYLKDTLERSDYKNGVSTRIGTVAKGEDKFFLKRIPVNSCDDIPFLKAKLQGGYDWIYRVQYYSKLVKRSRN